jgi:hypothetical protein
MEMSTYPWWNANDRRKQKYSLVNLKFLERGLGKQLQAGRSETNRSVAKIV